MQNDRTDGQKNNGPLVFSRQKKALQKRGERQKGEIAVLLAGAGEDARQLSEPRVAGAASAEALGALLAKEQSASPNGRAAP